VLKIRQTVKVDSLKKKWARPHLTIMIKDSTGAVLQSCKYGSPPGGFATAGPGKINCFFDIYCNPAGCTPDNCPPSGYPDFTDDWGVYSYPPYYYRICGCLHNEPS